MYPNPLKQKIKAGELVLGTAIPIPAANLVVMSCQTGVDFLWIDTEHAPYGTESLDAIPVLARHHGVAPMIRVAWNDPHLIKKAFDVGAVAVMVPQVNTAEEARAPFNMRTTRHWASTEFTQLATGGGRGLDQRDPHGQR